MYATLQQNKCRIESRKQMKIKANRDAYGNRNRKTGNKFRKKNAKSICVFWSQDDTVYQFVGKWLYGHIALVDSHISH